MFDDKRFQQHVNILFYYFALMAQHGITLEEIADVNYVKLAARYPQGYRAAIARADVV